MAVSQPTRILTAPLSSTHHVMSPPRFIAWTRWNLMWPQQRRLDNGVPHGPDLCMANHSKGPKRELDHSGDHHNSGCPSAALGLNWRHSALKFALRRFGQEAGLQVDMDPQTHDLLLRQFTAPECRVLFPKRS